MANGTFDPARWPLVPEQSHQKGLEWPGPSLPAVLQIFICSKTFGREFITATQDFITAAQMLNDDVRTVLAYYAHLRSQDASNTTDEFLATTLGAVQ